MSKDDWQRTDAKLAELRHTLDDIKHRREKLELLREISTEREEMIQTMEGLLQGRNKLWGIALYVFGDKLRKRSGAESTNEKYKRSKEAARQCAQELWAADTGKEFTKQDMITWCLNDLERKGLTRPTENTLWQWLKDQPNIVPDYVTRPGRPPKNR